jgi:hypothetical protein
MINWAYYQLIMTYQINYDLSNKRILANTDQFQTKVIKFNIYQRKLLLMQYMIVSLVKGLTINNAALIIAALMQTCK